MHFWDSRSNLLILLINRMKIQAMYFQNYIYSMSLNPGQPSTYISFNYFQVPFTPFQFIQNKNTLEVSLTYAQTKSHVKKYCIKISQPFFTLRIRIYHKKYMINFYLIIDAQSNTPILPFRGQSAHFLK